jgi:hypothetical protein
MMKVLAALTSLALALCGPAPVFAQQVGQSQVLMGPANGAGIPSWRKPANTDISGLGTMSTQNANNVNITGATQITGLPAPSSGSDAATKTYVDSSAVGLVVHTAARLGTTGALAANSYNNGTAGVGATLTGNSNGAISVDGVTPSVADRILVKNEAAAAHNGIYVVTTVGDGSTQYVLTRSTDANTAGTGSPNTIGSGSYVLVTAGTANTNSGYSVNSTVVTIGTDSIVWVQFSGGSAITSINATSGAVTITSNNGLTTSTVGTTITTGLTAARQTLPTSQIFTSGSGTYSTPAGVLWIEIDLIGGGGGGSGGNAGGNGAAGSATCWNASGAACTSPVYSAGGGGGGSDAGVGGSGGAISGSSNCDWSAVGGGGGAGTESNSSGNVYGTGGVGGSSSHGGGGIGVITGIGGGNGATNTGGGGAGGGVANANTRFGGGGGGSGGTCHVIIGSPSASYTYVVGSGGGGSAGAGSGGNGGNGGSGIIIVYEHYGS